MADDDKTKDNDLNDFTKIDPETLSDDLKEIYKSMQGDYTRKTQELANMRKEFDEKETTWEEKLKASGAMENELQQWRAWYKQLEEQAASGASDDNGVGGDKGEPHLDSLDTDGVSKEFTSKVKTLEQTIAEMKGELDSLHSGFKDSRDQTDRMFNYQAQLNEIASKYENVDKAELLKYALEQGQTDLEKAYRDLKRDDLIEVEVQRRLDEERKKERTAGITTPGQQVIVKRSETAPKSYAEASEQILKQLNGA